MRAALSMSDRCAGAVVVTDRTDRRIDPRARQVPIPADFDSPEMLSGGLPVKMALFDLPEIPQGAPCVYLDLDSVVLGPMDRLARLTERAALWTIPVFPRPFSALFRLLWRLTGRRVYATGNSSAFVWVNGFPGNPTQVFRDLHRAGTLPARLYHDDIFIPWACQDVIRGIPVDDIVNFRFEYLAPTMWLSTLFARLRRRARRDLVAVTFAGPLTKPETLAALPEGAVVRDHHGRVARWDRAHMGELPTRLAAWFGEGGAPG